MSRRPRRCPAGTCFHVLNRAAARWPLFEKLEDDESFERVLVEAHLQITLPILSYCLMPNHWHFVVRPTADVSISLKRRLKLTPFGAVSNEECPMAPKLGSHSPQPDFN